MKKYGLFILLFSFISSLIACTESAKPIAKDQLPEKAKSFLKEHFKNINTKSIAKEKSTYTVTFDKDFWVTFDKKGAWKKISYPKGVPGTIIPNDILEFVRKNYHRGIKMVALERNKKIYSLQLSNNEIIRFQEKDGHFIYLKD